jgi:hypothetical protein
MNNGELQVMSPEVQLLMSNSELQVLATVAVTTGRNYMYDRWRIQNWRMKANHIWMIASTAGQCPPPLFIPWQQQVYGSDRTNEWVSDWCLTPTQQFLQLQWDDDEVRFVLDQHAELDFYSASSLKQQSTGGHVAPLGRIFLIPRQPVFALSP